MDQRPGSLAECASVLCSWAPRGQSAASDEAPCLQPLLAPTGHRSLPSPGMPQLPHVGGSRCCSSRLVMPCTARGGHCSRQLVITRIRPQHTGSTRLRRVRLAVCFCRPRPRLSVPCVHSRARAVLVWRHGGARRRGAAPRPPDAFAHLPWLAANRRDVAGPPHQRLVIALEPRRLTSCARAHPERGLRGPLGEGVRH